MTFGGRFIAALRCLDIIQARLESFWARVISTESKVRAKTEPNRILVLRPDELGDAVLGLVFLRGLRQRFPKARILLATKPSLVALHQACPWVDELRPLRLPPRRFGRWPLAFLQGRREGRALRTWRPDAVFCPRFGTDWHGAAWAALYSGALRREGFGGDGEGLSPLRSHLQTANWNASGMKHEVLRGADALVALGLPKPNLKLDLFLSSAEKRQAKAWLKTRGYRSGQKLVAFGVGAGNPRRRWPLQRFILLGQLQENFKILVCGSAQDAPLAAALTLALGSRVIDACGLPLRQSAALLGACDLYVGADSGPMHLAAAQACPVVEISAHPSSAPQGHFNSPIRFGPWGVPAIVLQPKFPTPPCVGSCQQRHPHCILAIGVEEVAQACRLLLKSSLKTRSTRG